MPKFSRLLFAALAATVLCSAQVTTYTNRTNWAASVSNPTTIDFTKVGVTRGSFTTYPTPPGLTLSGVNFSNTTTGKAVYVVSQAYCCATYVRGFDQLNSPYDGSGISVTLPAGTTAAGFDIFTVVSGNEAGTNRDSVDVVVNGQKFVVQTVAAPQSVFFGFTSTAPVTTFTITPEQTNGATQADIMNFAFGAAPPPGPSINTDGTGAMNGAINLPGSGIVAGSWVTIKGSNFATAPADWSKLDFSNGLPTSLSGVQVLMNGKPGAIYYLQSDQINVQAPSSVPASGSVSIQVIRNGAGSNTITLNSVPRAPGQFPYPSPDGKTLYAAAVFLDGSLVGDPAVFPSTRKAKANDVVLLFATGLEVSPAGVLINPSGFSNPISVLIDSTPATVTATFLVAPGEWQLNIVIPSGLSDGNHQLVIQTGGASSQAGVMIPITH